MNSRPLQILLAGLCLTGLAAGCATIPSASNTTSPVTATTSPVIPSVSTSATTTASSTLATASGTPALGWSTYTDPAGVYSIAYPSSLGLPGLDDQGTLFWNPQTSDLPNLEVNIDTIVIATGTFQRWLVNATGWASANPKPDEISLVNGMQAYFYFDRPYSGETDVFLLTPVPGKRGAGTTMVYSLSFSCNDGQILCNPPAYWRQMLDSFRPLSRH